MRPCSAKVCANLTQLHNCCSIFSRAVAVFRARTSFPHHWTSLASGRAQIAPKLLEKNSLLVRQHWTHLALVSASAYAYIYFRYFFCTLCLEQRPVGPDGRSGPVPMRGGSLLSKRPKFASPRSASACLTGTDRVKQHGFMPPHPPPRLSFLVMPCSSFSIFKRRSRTTPTRGSRR